jgi:pseudouridine kinase
MFIITNNCLSQFETHQVTEHSKKQQLYELIRANPFISQQDLAASLGLSRSAVAGHIAGLIRERKLLGRAYVLPNHRPVTCIGAANLDRKLRSLAGIALHTSNPASQSESFGGVARNIAENLARLGTPVALLTATGKDSSGAALLAHAQGLGIDTGGTLQIEGAASGTYTAVLDQDGEMVVALADMALYDRLDPAFIDTCQTRIATSALVVADLNLPLETVDAVIAHARRAEVPLVLVAVSEPKMARLPRDLSGVRLLVLNRGELAARVGRELAGETDFDAAVAEVRAQGARDLIVTRGAEGVIFTRGGDIVRLYAHGAKVVDVTGAGDAFAAAVCWSLMQDLSTSQPCDLELACRRGLELSALTLGVAETVHPRLGADTLMNTNTQD